MTRRALICGTLRADLMACEAIPMKKLACLVMIVVLTGCIPIGVRVQNMYAESPTSGSR